MYVITNIKINIKINNGETNVLEGKKMNQTTQTQRWYDNLSDAGKHQAFNILFYDTDGQGKRYIENQIIEFNVMYPLMDVTKNG
jgi:hypothetical protein